MRQIILLCGLLVIFSCGKKNEKTQISNLTQQKELVYYKSQKLIDFYKDYENEIDDFTLVKTNGKFSGVIFKSEEKGSYVVELDTTTTKFSTPSLKAGETFSFDQLGMKNKIISNITLKAKTN
ncbi:MAG: hypothetical protein ACON5F_04915 [Jejuia sp.]